MEKPILFNTEMVKAILEGRKTQTRRVVKPQPTQKIDNKEVWLNSGKSLDKPPCKVGDTLWVRETWCQLWKLDGNDQIIEGTEKYYYRADGYNPTPFSHFPDENGFSEKDYPTWHPSIHMPRKAARIFLKVTNVRCERLQDITKDGAKAEGCIDFNDKIGNGKFEDVCEFDLTARDAFIELWDNIYNNWDANPWVWVIEFERMVLDETDNK